jgi:hypothetical protein
MCGLCQDRGWRGGSIDGPYASPYRWCTCPAADERRNREPELVDDGNRSREALIVLFAKREKFGDGYRGEF